MYFGGDIHRHFIETNKCGKFYPKKPLPTTPPRKFLATDLVHILCVLLEA